MRMRMFLRRAVVIALWLVIGGVGSVAAAAPAPVLILDPPALDRDRLTLSATLTDPAGRPVTGVPITFTLRTAFGRLPAGKAMTDAEGKAVVTVADLRARTLTAVATFAGTVSLAAREAVVSAALDHAGERRIRGSLISRDPPKMLVLFLAMLLGGIWSTYGYIFYQMARIRSAPGVTSAGSRASS